MKIEESCAGELVHRSPSYTSVRVIIENSTLLVNTKAAHDGDLTLTNEKIVSGKNPF